MNQEKERTLMPLRHAGFGLFTIVRLHRLRRKRLAEQAMLERPAQYRRLQFMRWLVSTGRLSEQIVEDL